MMIDDVPWASEFQGRPSVVLTRFHTRSKQDYRNDFDDDQRQSDNNNIHHHHPHPSTKTKYKPGRACTRTPYIEGKRADRANMHI